MATRQAVFPPPAPLQTPLPSAPMLAQAGTALATPEGEFPILQTPQRGSSQEEDVGTSRSLPRTGVPPEGSPGSAVGDVGMSRPTVVELRHSGPHAGQSGSAGGGAFGHTSGVELGLGGTWSRTAPSTGASPVSQVPADAAAQREGIPAPAIPRRTATGRRLRRKQWNVLQGPAPPESLSELVARTDILRNRLASLKRARDTPKLAASLQT